MRMRSALTGFMVWGLYPVWLLAGACDYLCHRRTDIDHHAGVTESMFHVAQFLTLAVVLIGAVLLSPSILALAIIALAGMAHSVLAHLDVKYSHKRRYISPFEQQVHGFMEVVPLVAIGLIALLWWPELQAEEPAPTLASTQASLWLIASYVVLAGTPVFEELLRTWRVRERGASQLSR